MSAAATGDERDRRRRRQAAAMSLIDELLAVRCVGCGASGPAVCPQCRRLLCAGATDAGLVDGVPVLAATRYPPEVGRFIVGCKDGGGWGLVGPLGDSLALAVAAGLAAAGPGAVGLVPVPGRRRDRLRRGGDPIAAISRRAAARLQAAGGVVRLRSVLVWTRSTADQGHLGAADRSGNVADAFGVRGRPPAQAVVCDDLVTTGATAAAAVEALRAVGTTVVAIAAIARPTVGPSTDAAAGRLR